MSTSSNQMEKFRAEIAAFIANAGRVTLRDGFVEGIREMDEQMVRNLSFILRILKYITLIFRLPYLKQGLEPG